jgi:hypothetical protein
VPTSELKSPYFPDRLSTTKNLLTEIKSDDDPLFVSLPCAEKDISF